MEKRPRVFVTIERGSLMEVGRLEVDSSRVVALGTKWIGTVLKETPHEDAPVGKVLVRFNEKVVLGRRGRIDRELLRLRKYDVIDPVEMWVLEERLVPERDAAERLIQMEELELEK